LKGLRENFWSKRRTSHATENYASLIGELRCNLCNFIAKGKRTLWKIYPV